MGLSTAGVLDSTSMELAPETHRNQCALYKTHCGLGKIRRMDDEAKRVKLHLHPDLAQSIPMKQRKMGWSYQGFNESTNLDT